MIIITQEKSGSKLILHIAGRIDTKTAPELEQTVREALEGLTELTFDLRETAYISSAGLRILLIAQKRMNKQGKMTVTNANSDLMDILEVTGFTDILTIE